MAAFCVKTALVCCAVLVMVMVVAAPGVKANHRCSVENLELTNEHVTTSTCQWGLINHCPCEAFSIVASQDRRWNQNMLADSPWRWTCPAPASCPTALEVEVPTSPNALVFSESSSIRYGRTYPYAGPLPLALKSADFGEGMQRLLANARVFSSLKHAYTRSWDMASTPTHDHL